MLIKTKAMLKKFWKNKRTEISAYASMAFILLDLYGIKTGPQLTPNEFYIHGVITIIMFTNFIYLMYLINQKKKENKDTIS